MQRNKSRFINAALMRIQRKSGGSNIVLSKANKELRTVEVSEAVLLVLLGRLETEIRTEYGIKDGNGVITTLYRTATDIGKDGEYLTERGKQIIDMLIDRL